MCNTCNRVPHAQCCPDSDEFYPQRICYRCYECGEPIYEDDLYMDYDGVQICQSCIDELTTVAIYSGGDAYGERSFP